MKRWFYAFFERSSEEELQEALENASLIENRFFRFYQAIMDVIASFFSQAKNIGYMLLAIFALVAVIVMGVIQDERTRSNYKDWLVRILIAVAIGSLFIKLAGMAYVLGRGIGK